MFPGRAVLPSSRADEGHAAHGAAPDSRRFWLLVIVATLGTTGALIAYTYIATFVTEVSGVAAGSMHVVLLARGGASLAGIAVVAAIADRWPRSVLTWTVAVQAVALIFLYAWGSGAVAAVVLFSLAGLAFAALTAAMGGRVLEVAPGRSDIAAAGVSTAVNVGISVGAWAGGMVLSGYGVRSTALVGGLITVLALALAILEQCDFVKRPYAGWLCRMNRQRLTGVHTSMPTSTSASVRRSKMPAIVRR